MDIKNTFAEQWNKIMPTTRRINHTLRFISIKILRIFRGVSITCIQHFLPSSSTVAVTELSRSPLPGSGTLSRGTSRQHRHWPSSAGT